MVPPVRPTQLWDLTILPCTSSMWVPPSTSCFHAGASTPSCSLAKRRWRSWEPPLPSSGDGRESRQHTVSHRAARGAPRQVPAAASWYPRTRGRTHTTRAAAARSPRHNERNQPVNTARSAPLALARAAMLDGRCSSLHTTERKKRPRVLRYFCFVFQISFQALGNISGLCLASTILCYVAKASIASAGLERCQSSLRKRVALSGTFARGCARMTRKMMPHAFAEV